jgi:amphi-Trp domain-containing protein
MANTTSDEQDVSRDEAADLLQGLAREIRGDGRADVEVGNKTVELHPASAMSYGIEIEERSPMLGGARETVTVTLEWESEDE